MAIINPHTGKPIEAPQQAGHEQLSEEAQAKQAAIIEKMGEALEKTHKQRYLCLNNFFQAYGPLLPPELQNITGVLMQFRQDMAVLIQQYGGSFKDAVFKGVGRNDPCPCESGEKYKKCCLPRVNQLGPVTHDDGTVEIEVEEEDNG